MLDLIALQEVSSAQRLDLRRANCHDFTVALLHCVLRMRACEHELCTLSILIGVVAIIPLIDAASNDDSNGG